jgi:thioredoxin-related protein
LGPCGGVSAADKISLIQEASMKTRLLAAGILAWACVLPALAAGNADVPLTDSLKADARVAGSRKVPIMLLFTSPECHYCERVKSEFLGPMVDDPAYRNKVLIRQVEVGSDWALVGFDGKKTTHGAFAASQKVFMVPTVKVVDGHGKELSKPIVGLLTPDYYFGYIESAMEEGLDKLRGKKP